MNALFQWLVHGEVEDINDSSILHHNGHTIDNKEELAHRKKQVRFRVRDAAVVVMGVVEELAITELWNMTKQGIGHTRLNGTSHVQLVRL